MWERIEIELEEINVKNLGFDYPICSEQNHDIMEACKEFIQNEELKINIDEVLDTLRSSDAVPERMSDFFFVPERMSDCFFYRNLWWEKGEFSEKAKWEEVT
ncbi:1907_t:CDS:2, partial [Funneliformis geosporum]